MSLSLKKFSGSRGLLGISTPSPSAWWIAEWDGKKYLIFKTSQGWTVQPWQPSNVSGGYTGLWSSTLDSFSADSKANVLLNRLTEQRFATRREALQALQALLSCC